MEKNLTVARDPQWPTPLVYAYLGDAVYELMVRRRLVQQRPRKINSLHRETVRLVCAKQQRIFMDRLLPLLSEAEREAARKGRNLKPRHVPASASGEEYAASTAFEALIGYLFWEGREQRLQELIDLLLADYFLEAGEE
ncbi:MAG: Mini-ribonuclease 3 [Bacillota bacterium]